MSTAVARLLPLHLRQHPDEHGAKRAIFLAVDQQLGDVFVRRSEMSFPSRSDIRESQRMRRSRRSGQ